MRKLSVAVAVSSVAIGVGGGAVGYRSVADGLPIPVSHTSAAAPAPPTAGKQTVLRWAPCKPPAERDGRACVVDVVRTVVGSEGGGGTIVASTGTGASPAPADGPPITHGSDHGVDPDEFDDHDDHHDDDHDHHDDHHDDHDDHDDG